MKNVLENDGNDYGGVTTKRVFGDEVQNKKVTTTKNIRKINVCPRKMRQKLMRVRCKLHFLVCLLMAAFSTQNLQNRHQ